MNFSAVVTFGRDFACERQSGVFFDWQRVHVGAHQHGRPGTVLHDADNAIALEIRVIVFAKVFRHFAAGRAQFLRQQRRQLTLRDFFHRLFLRENRTGGQDRPAYAEGYYAAGQGKDRQSKNLHTGEPKLSFRVKSRNLLWWNSKRTQCSSVPIRRRGSLRLSWAKPARSRFTGARRMAQRRPTWNRFIPSFGPTATLSILELKQKSSRAI